MKEKEEQPRQFPHVLQFWDKIKPSLLWEKWHWSKTIFLQASTWFKLFYILNIEYSKPVATVIALSVLALFCLFVNLYLSCKLKQLHITSCDKDIINNRISTNHLIEVFATLHVMEIKPFPYICMLYIIIYLHTNNNINDDNINISNIRMVKAF